MGCAFFMVFYNLCYNNFTEEGKVISVEIQSELNSLLDEVIDLYRDKVEEGDIFVLGASTSEVSGARIGKDPHPGLGETIVAAFQDRLPELGVHLAVQGCEHINRSLVIEKEVAKKYQLEVVNVMPAINAGGGCSVAAFNQFKDPVVVDSLVATSGIDIGDTHIGMHVKRVQIPMRFQHNTIGHARVNGLTSRPKLIGGPRAQHL